jgi:hypothetical protein
VNDQSLRQNGLSVVDELPTQALRTFYQRFDFTTDFKLQNLAQNLQLQRGCCGEVLLEILPKKSLKQ